MPLEDYDKFYTRHFWIYIVMSLAVCGSMFAADVCAPGVFDDTPSRTVRAQSVFDGRARGTAIWNGNLVTMKFKLIKAYKGGAVGGASMSSGDVTVRAVVSEDLRYCVQKELVGMKSRAKYFVYLNGTEAETGVRWMSSLPEVFHSRKEKEIKEYSCLDCAKLPTTKLKPASLSLRLKSGQGIDIKCHVTGRPEPHITWYRDAIPLTGEDPRTEIVQTRQSSQLQINPVTEANSGTYRCEATNVLGFTSSMTSIAVEPADKIEYGELCPANKAGYCMNNGICYKLLTGQLLCKCVDDFEGPRCKDRILNWGETKQEQSTLGDHPLAFAGLILGAIIFIVMVVLICYVIRRTSRIQRDAKLTASAKDSSKVGPTALPSNGDVIHATKCQDLAFAPPNRRLVDRGTQTDDAAFKELPQVLISTLNETNDANIYNGVVMRPKGSVSQMPSERKRSSLTRPRLSAISNTPGTESKFHGFGYPTDRNSSWTGSPGSSDQTLVVPEREQTASQMSLTSALPNQVPQRSETLHIEPEPDEYDNLTSPINGVVDKRKNNTYLDMCGKTDGFSHRLATEPGSRHLHPNYTTNDHDWQQREEEVQALLQEFEEFSKSPTPKKTNDNQILVLY